LVLGNCWCGLIQNLCDYMYVTQGISTLIFILKSIVCTSMNLTHCVLTFVSPCQMRQLSLYYENAYFVYNVSLQDVALMCMYPNLEAFWQTFSKFYLSPARGEKFIERGLAMWNKSGRKKKLCFINKGLIKIIDFSVRILSLVYKFSVD
jgi:hypothetical protein